MPNLPSSVLNSFYAYDFPDKVEAFKSFDAMLEELACINILHNDFHADNILYDKVANTFYPIDMADYTEDFNKLTADEQKEWSSCLDFRINDCRELIKNRRNEEKEARDLAIKEARELRALRRQQAEGLKLASSTQS